MATIRKTILTDMPIVLSIIQYGREKMIASGNSHQWGKLHPSDEQIKMDIEFSGASPKQILAQPHKLSNITVINTKIAELL